MTPASRIPTVAGCFGRHGLTFDSENELGRVGLEIFDRAYREGAVADPESKAEIAAAVPALAPDPAPEPVSHETEIALADACLADADRVNGELLREIQRLNNQVAQLAAIREADQLEVTGNTTTRRTSRAIAVRLERGDYVRAGGDVLCDRCGLPYHDHGSVPGAEWLTPLCNGRLVKL